MMDDTTERCAACGEPGHEQRWKVVGIACINALRARAEKAEQEIEDRTWKAERYDYLLANDWDAVWQAERDGIDWRAERDSLLQERASLLRVLEAARELEAWWDDFDQEQLGTRMTALRAAIAEHERKDAG